MADYSIDVNNSGTVGVDSEVTIEGLDDISVDSTVTLEPVTTTSTVTLEPVTSTLNSTSTVGLDVEPVAVDSCVRVELAPLPATSVCTPWEQHIGFNVLGVELLRLSWCGEVRSRVEPTHAHPQVVGTVDRSGGHTRSGPVVRVLP